MWQEEVKQLLVHLRVKSSPLGRRQGWQQLCQILVLAKVPCQVVCLGSKHARGKRLLFYKAAACGLNNCMLYSPSRWLTYRALAKGLPRLLCPGRHAGRLLSGLNHLSLYYSSQTQRAAEGRGEPLPPAH